MYLYILETTSFTTPATTPSDHCDVPPVCTEKGNMAHPCDCKKYYTCTPLVIDVTELIETTTIAGGGGAAGTTQGSGSEGGEGGEGSGATTQGTGSEGGEGGEASGATTQGSGSGGGEGNLPGGATTLSPTTTSKTIYIPVLNECEGDDLFSPTFKVCMISKDVPECDHTTTEVFTGETTPLPTTKIWIDTIEFDTTTKPSK